MWVTKDSTLQTPVLNSLCAKRQQSLTVKLSPCISCLSLRLSLCQAVFGHSATAFHGDTQREYRRYTEKTRGCKMCVIKDSILQTQVLISL